MIQIRKDRCINSFHKERYKSTNGKLRGVSQDLRLKFLTLPEGSQICSPCRSQLINTTGISSLNSGNITESSSRDKVESEDHKFISDDDENQLYDDESNFSYYPSRKYVVSAPISRQKVLLSCIGQAICAPSIIAGVKTSIT